MLKNRSILLVLSVVLAVLASELVFHNHHQTSVHAIANNIAEDCTTTNFVTPIDETVAPLIIRDTFGSRVLQPSGTSRYDFHRGVDWSAPKYTPLRAVTDGVVMKAQKTFSGTGGGKNVLLYHDSINCETRYAHMHEVFVSEGDTVTMGQVIGTVGSTGATYDHLHFEVRKGQSGTQRAAIHPLNTPFIPWDNMNAPTVSVLGAFPDGNGLTALIEVNSTFTEPDLDELTFSIANMGLHETFDFVALNAATTAMGTLDDPLVGDNCLIPFDLTTGNGYRTVFGFRHLPYNKTSVVETTATDFAGFSDSDSLAMDSTVSIAPFEQTATAVPFGSVVLSFIITNQSSNSETFDLELFSAQGWSSTLPARISLAGGQGKKVNVTLNIDKGTFGPGDCGFLLATPHGSSGVAAAASFYRVERYAHVSVAGNDFIGTGGPDSPFATIDRALSLTDNGGTIRVAQGTYHEAVDLDSTIHLLGGYSSNWESRTFAEGYTQIDATSVNTTTLEVIGDHGPLIEGFTITGGERPDGSGGGVRLVGGAAPTLDSNWVVGNSAESAGGVYIAESGSYPPTLRNNVIANNVATERGAGLYIHTRMAIVEDNVIHYNSAHDHGGGIYLRGTTEAYIAGNRIENNRTMGDGAGLYLNNDSKPTVVNNTIARNRAHDDGGGIHIRESNALIANNVLWGNQAISDGDGISVWVNGTPDIYHNTLAGSSAHESVGLFIHEDAVPTVVNNLIVGYYHSVECDGDSSIVVSHTFVPTVADVFDCTQVGTVTGNAALTADYHLGSGSDAIDAGLLISGVAELETDRDGDERPFNGSPDIGADEFILP